MTRARSNPPYIHLQLSSTPLWTDHHNRLLYKAHETLWGRPVLPLPCFLPTCLQEELPIGRFFAAPLQEAPQKIAPPKNGSFKKKTAICPDLLHRSVMDAPHISLLVSGVAATRSKQPSNDDAAHSLCSWKPLFCFLLQLFVPLCRVAAECGWHGVLQLMLFSKAQNILNTKHKSNAKHKLHKTHNLEIILKHVGKARKSTSASACKPMCWIQFYRIIFKLINWYGLVTGFVC